MPTLTQVLLLLEHYKYILIFPITVIEGPIITVITGLLVSLGYLNGFLAYVILVLGDLTGDLFYYALGRYGRHAAWIKKWGKYIGYSEKSEAFLENHFKKHPIKTFMLGKVAHGVGTTVLIAAGIARVSIPEFLWYNLLGTLPKTLILVLIGYYVGNSYEQIDKYLGSVAVFTTVGAVVLVVGYVLMTKYASSYFSDKK